MGSTMYGNRSGTCLSHVVKLYAEDSGFCAKPMIPSGQALVDLVVLFLVLLPLGSVLLRFGEWLAVPDYAATALVTP